MPAFVLAEIDVVDPDAYESYKALASASVTAFGGAYRVRGGAVEVFEGEAPTGRVVVLEFPDMEAARAWYYSDGYQAAAAIRQAASRGRMFLIDGVDPPSVTGAS
ncbi:MAG: DUF1330 domain-containing protein [Acidimicrobiales bacterium]